MKFINVVNKGPTNMLARFIVTTSCVEENEVLECMVNPRGQDPNGSTKECESINTMEENTQTRTTEA